MSRTIQEVGPANYQLPKPSVGAWRLGIVDRGLGGSCYHRLARLCISFNSNPTVHGAAMYLTAACSLLPFWALLWPKKPLSEDTFGCLCSLTVAETEYNFFLISFVSAIIPYGIKSPGALQHWKSTAKGNLNRHCLSLSAVLSFWLWRPQAAITKLEGKGSSLCCSCVLLFLTICLIVFH